MTPRFAHALSAYVLAVGLAGMPLEPLRMLGAAAICAAVLGAGRFSAAIAMLAVIFGGWLQHGTFRVTLVIAAALLGLVIRFWGASTRVGVAVLAIATVMAMALLALG